MAGGMTPGKPRIRGQRPWRRNQDADAAKWQSGDGPSSGDRLVRKGRLLIVDDEPQIGNTLRLLLDPDHEVVPVTSGREALERIKTDTAFDIIFCDLDDAGDQRNGLLQGSFAGGSPARRSPGLHDRRRVLAQDERNFWIPSPIPVSRSLSTSAPSSPSSARAFDSCRHASPSDDCAWGGHGYSALYP